MALCRGRAKWPNFTAYTDQRIRSFDSGFVLEDESIIALVPEYDVLATNHVHPLFPSSWAS